MTNCLGQLQEVHFDGVVVVVVVHAADVGLLAQEGVVVELELLVRQRLELGRAVVPRYDRLESEKKVKGGPSRTR